MELIDREQEKDVFEVESSQGQIVLRGNNGVSVASALNYYLKYFCHRQMTWWDDVQPLNGPLPVVPEKIRIASEFRYRGYLNYCTFSYTAAWWDWKRWQREIDWMAMYGINMPLAITGQEATWQATLRRFKMNDDEIRQFLCGPAFFAWQWMANLEGWGGPLPQSWIDSHLQLGQQIVQRQRELGMTPILQGFTGFVPRAIKNKFPEARIKLKPKWCKVFEGTAQLDPLDPLFRRMGTAFLEEQKKLFGTDHLYAADPFHESSPPNGTPEYLPAVAKEVLSTMQAVDPQAKIAMQTWSLRKPLVTNIPPQNIVLLALTGTGWQKTEGFWNRPWVVGVLHNYGGRVFMAGSLEKALSNALILKTTEGAANVAGSGIFPESIEQNPVFYDAAAETAWMQKVPDPQAWLHSEIRARYGRDLPVAQDAWSILLKSLYTNGAEEGSVESPICSRPALLLDRAAPNANFRRHYDPELVWQAWRSLQSASKELAHVDAYKYDLIDLARQAMADLSIPLHNDISVAYGKEDHAALLAASAKFLDLAKDMDALLGTRRECLLGVWLNASKKWATNEAERRQYERNARLQVTVWGPSAPDALLFDYSNRQWNGLIGGYYIPRWKKFLDYLAGQPSGVGRFTGKDIKLSYERPSDDANAFYRELSSWEQAWCNLTDEYTDMPRGDSIKVSSHLLAKWHSIRKVAYQRYDLQTLSVR
jgi:alpha-N-acetylglucosaminidase